jgi:2-methylisocitrate lyase-like PEP mutase family enzyme
MMGDMDAGDRTRRAARLRELHHRGSPLVLPNAWDAASARQVEAAGFDAVATTSGGVAVDLGFADGEQMPVDEAFAAVARIAEAVDLPVTADIEAGYGLSMGELAERLVASGASGCNLEDTDHTAGGTLRPMDEQAERVAALREGAARCGVELVVNARVDVFVRREGDPDQRVASALERAEVYRRAGADCVYPILASVDETAALVRAHDGPVNAMAVTDWTPASQLREVGVARISFGSQLQHHVHDVLGRALDAIAAGDDGWAVG